MNCITIDNDPDTIMKTLTLEISERMRSRYPDLNSLVKCGLLKTAEVELLDDTWWKPILWSMQYLTKKEKLYKYGKHHLMERLIEWKKKLMDVQAFSATPVPLVYTQVMIN